MSREWTEPCVTNASGGRWRQLRPAVSGVSDCRSMDLVTGQQFNGSTVQRFNGSTVQRFNGSTVQRFNGSTARKSAALTVVNHFGGEPAAHGGFHADSSRLCTKQDRAPVSGLQRTQTAQFTRSRTRASSGPLPLKPEIPDFGCLFKQVKSLPGHQILPGAKAR